MMVKRFPFRKEDLDEFNESAIGNDPATYTRRLPAKKIRARIATNDLRKNIKAEIKAAKENKIGVFPNTLMFKNITYDDVESITSTKNVPNLSHLNHNIIPNVELGRIDQMLGLDSFGKKKKDGFSEMLGL